MSTLFHGAFNLIIIRSPHLLPIFYRLFCSCMNVLSDIYISQSEIEKSVGCFPPNYTSFSTGDLFLLTSGFIFACIKERSHITQIMLLIYLDADILFVTIRCLSGVFQNAYACLFCVIL